jgi:hypothetical protein
MLLAVDRTLNGVEIRGDGEDDAEIDKDADRVMLLSLLLLLLPNLPYLSFIFFR